MQLKGEQRIAADRQTVWNALNDPDILRQCIPGCRALEREPDGSMRATVEIKVGPIGARFEGAVTLSNIDAPNSYTISGSGQGGTVGHARGAARVRLTDDGSGDGRGTVLTHDVEVDVGGRLAQLGGPLIDATARQLADRFFRKFGELVAAPAAQEAGTAPPTITAGASPAAPAAMRPAPSLAPAPAATASTPIVWILAVVVAALAGYLAGRGLGGEGSEWMGLAIGLALLIVGAAGFEAGRRAGARVVTLDPDAFIRLLSGLRT